MWSRLAVAVIVALATLPNQAEPAHRWRSDDDLSKMYDSATPNPTGSLSGPWFDVDGSANVTGIAGKIAHLACRVKNLGNQTVTWLRHRDTRLLTTGLYTYTPDKRFSAIHRSGAEDWVLEIRAATSQDQGVYECQVSTTPVRSHLVYLEIAEPVVTLHGGDELHINHGSTINLTCEIKSYPKATTYVIWYKDNKPLHDSKRFAISLSQSSSSSPSSSSSGWRSSFSWLSVASAVSSDTGVYRCATEAGESKPISVHIIAGETRAGLQFNSSSSPSPWSWWLAWLMVMMTMTCRTLFNQRIFEPL